MRSRRCETCGPAGRSISGWEPTKHLDRARSDRFGVVTYDKARAYDGVTLMTGLFGNEVSLSLRAMDGTELHRWPAAVSRGSSPTGASLPADQVPTNDWDTHLHGALLHPDGSVIFNYDYLGLVKLDRCGSVVWRLPYRTHHSISEDARRSLLGLGAPHPGRGLQAAPAGA